MNNPLDPWIALPLAFVMMLAALGIWYVYIRPVPENSGTGVIASCQFLLAETVERSVPRLMRSLEYMPAILATLCLNGVSIKFDWSRRVPRQCTPLWPGAPLSSRSAGA